MTSLTRVSVIALLAMALVIPFGVIGINSVKASTPILGGIAKIQGVDDGNHTVITITKNGTEPTGPIIVVPPKPGENNTQHENGTILTPPANNDTIIIIDNGTVTEIPNGNVTHVDNGTVIISDENRTVTETPGNVTVIDPPKENQTSPAENATAAAPCACQNQTGNASIPPVVVTPAPGQNVTTSEPPPNQGSSAIPPPANNQTQTNGNETGGNNRPTQLPVFPSNNETQSNQTGGGNVSNPMIPSPQRQ